MNLPTLATPPGAIVYPESDGKPMADNTRQFRWIQTLQGNLAAQYRDRPDVLVAGDLLCYPREGHPEICIAPDVLVVFGRPRGDRGCYKQWEEDGVPLTVVFEIFSPTNTYMEMDDKFAFYEEHGVEEYYVYDPDTNRLKAFVRQGEVFRRVRPVQGFVSPRLGIRFDLSGPEMVVYGPDGRRFPTFEELTAERDRAEQRAERMAELARKVLGQTASPDERAELQRLLQPPSA